MEQEGNPRTAQPLRQWALMLLGTLQSHTFTAYQTSHTYFDSSIPTFSIAVFIGFMVPWVLVNTFVFMDLKWRYSTATIAVIYLSFVT